jgi:phosphomannomutase/phosphoglucomutase
MSIPRQIFREYDIRGVADRDLSDELVRAIGFQLARMLAEGEKAKPGARLRIAVGLDCRVSSPRIHAALVDGLLRAGVSVLDVGVGPTPLLYLGVHHLDADGGVMITGSHNAGDENGLKMMRGKGSFFGADIRELADRVERDGVPEVERTGSLESFELGHAYVERLTQDLRLAASGLKVVVDGGNGSAGPLGVEAIQAAGLTPDPLYCDMDGTFPNHHPDPTVEKNLRALIDRVRETGATVGIAWDGDGDRMGAVDANGEIVWGDRLLVLFSRDLLAAHPGAAIIGEVKCSQSLYDDIAAHGGRPIMWKTGHSLIKTKMKEEKALLAGEMSGHLFFADRYFGYDDGIYAALRLLEVLAKSKKTMGEMLADLPRTFVTPEIRVDCTDRAKFEVVERIKRRFAASHRVIEVDGARIVFGDGAWGLVRASNTGPILVLRFEARTEARLDAIRREVEEAVAEERRALPS